MAHILSDLPDQDGCRCSIKERKGLRFIPLRITGAKFSVSEVKGLSTLKERIAQLLAVYHFRTLLHPVHLFLVCDNANLLKVE